MSFLLLHEPSIYVLYASTPIKYHFIAGYEVYHKCVVVFICIEEKRNNNERRTLVVMYGYMEAQHGSTCPLTYSNNFSVMIQYLCPMA